MQVPYFSNATARITEDDFADTDSIESISTFLFDACYAYAVAINALLRNGTDPSEIRGKALLEELKQVSFEGVSGLVAFNAQGDRLGSYTLINTQQQIRRGIGTYDSNAGELTLLSDPLWVSGNHSRYPPS
eukprot:4743013-Amphidinium_carterae.1